MGLHRLECTLDPARGREEASKVRETAGPRQPRRFLVESPPEPGAGSSSPRPARPRCRATLPAGSYPEKPTRELLPLKRRNQFKKKISFPGRPDLLSHLSTSSLTERREQLSLRHKTMDKVHAAAAKLTVKSCIHSLMKLQPSPSQQHRCLRQQ